MQDKTADHVLTTDAAHKTALEAEIAQLDQEIAATVTTLRHDDTDGLSKDLDHFSQLWADYKALFRDTVIFPASAPRGGAEQLQRRGGHDIRPGVSGGERAGPGQVRRRRRAGHREHGQLHPIQPIDHRHDGVRRADRVAAGLAALADAHPAITQVAAVAQGWPR